MALRVRELPVGDWMYEMKFDGYRALAFKAGKEVRLLSRNRTLFNAIPSLLRPSSRRRDAEDKAHDLSIHQPPGEETRPLGSGNHSRSYEELRLGRAVTRCPDQVHGVDQR